MVSFVEPAVPTNRVEPNPCLSNPAKFSGFSYIKPLKINTLLQNNLLFNIKLSL